MYDFNMQEKKKILYIITKGNFGGAQRYVYDLATNLPKDRFEAVVACGDKDGNTLQEKLSEKNIRVIKIEGLGREIKAVKDFQVFRNLIKIIKEEKPDVVHLNSSKIGLLGSLAILYLKLTTKDYYLKSIFTAHGWAFNEKSRSALSRLIYYLGHYLTMLICDTTIAVSERARRDVTWLPFINDKLKVVYNGISNFKMLSKKEARILISEETSPISSGQAKTLLFSVSELHKNKGVDVALKALSLLPKETIKKITYSVAGDGEEKQNLEVLIKDLGLENQVRLLGFVPEAKKFLSGADIFLLPSRTESLPYALLEAGLAELPVISTCVGGTSEIIHDMQNGILVHPQNPKEIAEAILYLLDHKEKQKEFGDEARKTILNFFSLEKMVEETTRLYQ
jgi:glycosyltransferase involved in cell wall biosynthesis